MIKILAVDDNQDILLTIKTALEEVDFQVVTAESSEVALRILHNEKFDLILMDIMMPGLDGIATVIKIREQYFMKDTPIIFLTASLDENSLSFGKICGDDIIQKPVKTKELIERIGKVLKNWEGIKNGKNISG